MRCGAGVTAFWDLTPRETYAYLTACQWRQEREQQQALWHAWHVAYLSRVKRLPSLKRLLNPPQAKVLRGEELEQRRRERDEMVTRFEAAREPHPQPLSARGEGREIDGC